MSGSQLWNSHGLVKLITPSLPGHTGLSPGGLTAVGDTLFFAGWDPDHGVEIWKTDGTEAGTVLVRDINPGPTDSYVGYLSSAALDGSLFFGADDGVHGIQLWRSDGTAEGTQSVSPEGVRLLSDPVTLGRRVFFVGLDSSGDWLWSTDATGSDTIRLKSIGPIYDPHLLTSSGRFVYYADQSGTGIWRTDGTEADTILLASIFASDLTDVGGTLFFVGDDGVHGRELWRSDGTPAATRMVRDIQPGELGSEPGSLTNIDGVLVFAASDGVHGREMWRSDGSEAGTSLVADIAPGVYSSSPSGFARSGPLVFFSADDGETGFELWAVSVSALGLPAGLHRPGAARRALPSVARRGLPSRLAQPQRLSP